MKPLSKARSHERVNMAKLRCGDDYVVGYLRGLLRRRHGERFCTEGERWRIQ